MASKWGHPVHGFGYKADPVGHRYTNFRMHPAIRLGVAPLPDVHDLTAFCPPIWDQGQTGSCVGHGFAGAISTTFAGHGQVHLSPVWPRGIYANARAIDRAPGGDGKLPSLVDEGAQPNSAVRAIDFWGIALEDGEDGGRTANSPDYSLYLQEHVNDEPSFAELEDESLYLVRGFNAIEDSDPTKVGPPKVVQFCQAIATGHAVMAAVEADGNEFQGADGSKVLGYLGNNFDHWVHFVAYRTNSSGKKELCLRNSWSPSWALMGSVWVSEDFINRGTANVLVANLGE